MKRKVCCLLLVFIAFISLIIVTPTHAKFSNEYTSEEDIVGLNLNFDISMTHVNEYEEIRVDANSYDVFNVHILNDSDKNLFYGVWYQMIQPDEIDDNIIVSRLDTNLTNMSGEILSKEDKTVSVIVKNNTSNDIILHVGVLSSFDSVNDIAFYGGKKLITGDAREVDYFYDEVHHRYVSDLDNNSYFFTTSNQYSFTGKVDTFTSSHLGSYLVEAWSPSSVDNKGAYTSGILKLDNGESIDIYVSGNDDVEKNSEVRLGASSNLNDSSMNRIMVASFDKESYISGHYGFKSPSFVSDEYASLCNTGLEDVGCSYHSSLKIFKHTTYFKGNDVPDFNSDKTASDKSMDGFVRITPVVPSIESDTIKISMGKDFDLSQVKCVDNGNGCYIVRVLPLNISDLAVGKYNASIMVSDDDGIVYRYTKPFEIVP